MANFGKWTPLVALTLVVTLFAGCVGDDDADPEAAPDAGTDPDTSTGDGDGKAPGQKEKDEDAAQAGCQFAFCIEGHVYAPVWDTGMTWTYDVSGSYYPQTDYSATLGVFKNNDDHYLLGTDSDTELKNSVHGYGVMTGQVQKDTYSILEHDDYQDVLGFRELEGATWKSELWSLEFTIVKGPSMEIEHAQGTSLGIEVNGETEEGHKLLVQYASDVAWITKLVYQGPDGELLLDYTLSDFNHDGNVAGMKVWEKSKSDSFRAAGNSAPAGASSWRPGDPASLVLAHIRTSDGVAGNAFIQPPEGTATQVSHDGPQTEDIEFPFFEDDWYIAIVVDRGAGSGGVTDGNMVVFMFSVIERTA